MFPIHAKDAVAGEVTPTRNEATPPPGQPGLGFRKTERLAATVLASQDVRRAGKTPPGSSREAPGPGSPWSGAGEGDRGGRRVRIPGCKGAVLRRGRRDIRAGLLRDPPALSCDPHATFADSWSPSVGCACRSELAHWRGPGNALISLVQMRPGIS